MYYNIKEAEALIAGAVYRQRPGAGYVLQTYEPYIAAVAAECSDTAFAPCAEYALPGSSEQIRNIEECISQNTESDVFLLARRGALITGESEEDARDKETELEEKCKELVLGRAQDVKAAGAEEFDVSAVNIKALPYVVVADDPFVLECCSKGETVKAYLDAFAQLVGTDMQVTDNDPWKVERLLLGYSVSESARMLLKSGIPMTGALGRMGGQQPALNSAIGRNAVLVKGVGAVCAGRNESDAEAIAAAVSANCMAACYVDAKPISSFEARLLRYQYLALKK